MAFSHSLSNCCVKALLTCQCQCQLHNINIKWWCFYCQYFHLNVEFLSSHFSIPDTSSRISHSLQLHTHIHICLTESKKIKSCMLIRVAAVDKGCHYPNVWRWVTCVYLHKFHKNTYLHTHSLSRTCEIPLLWAKKRTSSILLLAKEISRCGANINCFICRLMQQQQQQQH